MNNFTKKWTKLFLIAKKDWIPGNKLDWGGERTVQWKLETTAEKTEETQRNGKTFVVHK